MDQVVIVFTIEQAEWLRDYLRAAALRDLTVDRATRVCDLADMIEDAIVNDAGC